MLIRNSWHRAIAIALAAVLALSLWVSAGTAFASPAELRNGGFEEPAAGGIIPGWTTFIAPKGSSVTYEITDERAHSGSYSLKITDKDGADGVSIWSQAMDIVPGENYTGSVWMYIEGSSFMHNGASVPNRGSFIMRFYNEAGQQVGSDTDALIHHTGQSKWVKLTTKSLQAPSDAKTVRLMASLSNFYQTSGAFYDDFEIEGVFPGETAPAARSLSISGPAAATVKENYSVNLAAMGASSLYAVETILSYDPAQFQYVSVQAAESFHGGEEVYAEARELAPGRLKVIVTQLGERAVSGDSEVAIVQFQPLAASASAKIELEPFAIAAKQDADETGVSTVFQEGMTLAVTVKAHAGDVDDNGRVDLADLIIVAQAVGSPASGAYARFDLNGDGKIDFADMAMISRLLVEGDTE
ncbi:cohesin domain-containing protein [Paenibacillus sp. NPDC057967]|uniref:cohesin domain-containing protein n=1 Tax=Paenibacillus sp. NPDC057967 TaxID=3346293 RepID=UPI0036D7F6F5